MDVERLKDIPEAIEAINKYIREGRTRFDSDELVRTWCRVWISLRDRDPFIPEKTIWRFGSVPVQPAFAIDFGPS